MKQVANSPHYKQQGNWDQLISQRLLGLFPGTRGINGQMLTSASSVTIPETIAGRLSAPAPFSFLSGECSPAADLQ